MKKFVSGLIIGLMVATSTSVFAMQIDAVFGQIKLVVDGKSVDKETLLYNGTTYVPLRAAAEALGKDVSYDDKSKTAYIGEIPEVKKNDYSNDNITAARYYAEYPSVPDFSSIITTSDETYFMYQQEKNSRQEYVYRLAHSDKHKMSEYRTLLQNSGFERINETIGTQTFRKDGVMVETEENRDYFHIYLSQTENDGAKSSNEFYSDYKSVPNFAYVVGISDSSAIREVVLNDIRYKYKLVDIPTDSVDIYVKALQQHGFQFYDELSGIKMYYNSDYLVGIKKDSTYLTISVNALND